MTKNDQKPWIDFTDRIVLITGAASGIGQATAGAFLETGAKVIAADLDEEGLENFKSSFANFAECITTRKIDVRNERQWDTLVEGIEKDFGKLDVLVNGAGVVMADKVGAFDGNVYNKIFSVNVEGTLLGMNAALKLMRKAGKGAIINISSAASLRASTTLASYGASKAAVQHYTTSAALDLARAGYDIRINSVHPGLIETPMADTFYEIYSMIGSPTEIIEKMTTGRAGQAHEVADLILFLSSDRAQFISGAAIPIDRAQSV